MTTRLPPVCTLTTDFGVAGPFVGVMKAVILAHAPAAPIHDLTHGIAPCQSAEAGFWLTRCYRYFPAGSLHVAIVDPGVGSARAILGCEWDGHRFLAPDNGILPMITGGAAPLHALAPDWVAARGWPAASRTFHGRDLFAPLAAELISGRTTIADIGPVLATPEPPAAAPPARQAGRISGTVVAIDTWGNLITNIDADLLQAFDSTRVTIAGHELALAGTYAEAAPGALLALVNAFGTVEIACRNGSAAERLGLRHGAAVWVSTP